MDGLLREKKKPGERSIQGAPLAAKKGDGCLGFKAHDLLYALKESDTRLSLLFVTDVVAAWHNRQLISLLTSEGARTVLEHVVSCKIGILHPCVRLCQSNDVAQCRDEAALWDVSFGCYL